MTRRVLVAGASGYAGALAAASVWRPPAPRARRGDLARRGRHAARPALPAHRVPVELDASSTSTSRATSTPRSSPIRTAPGRRLVAALRGAGMPVVDISADFRLARPVRPTSALVRRSRCPELLARPSTGSPSSTARRSARPKLVANPGCYPTAALLALAPAGRGRAGRRRRDQRGVGGLGGRAGRGGAASRSSTWTRTSAPTRSRATATRPRSRRSSGSWALGAGDLRSASPAARPGPAGELLRRPGRAAGGRGAPALYEARYADEPFVELVDEPPGVRDVRDTNLCRVHVGARRAPGGRSPSPRSTTSGRGRPGRRSRT